LLGALRIKGYDLKTQPEIKPVVMELTKGFPTFPYIFFDGEFIGTLVDLQRMKQSGELQKMHHMVNLHKSLSKQFNKKKQ